MENLNSQSFSKSERISSKLIIDSLFGGENSSMSSFPLRMFYAISDRSEEVPASVLISVPKKRFHNAVDRNRMKRQIRDSYRRNKKELWEVAVKSCKSVRIAFICVTDNHCTSEQIEKSVKKLLGKLVERI